MARERKINWDAAFDVPGEPQRLTGPGGGKKYAVDITAFVSHAGKEREIEIHVQSKGKDDAERKAWQQTLVEIIRFIQSNLKKPLTPNEANQVGDKFAQLFRQDLNVSNKN